VREEPSPGASRHPLPAGARGRRAAEGEGASYPPWAVRGTRSCRRPRTGSVRRCWSAVADALEGFGDRQQLRADPNDQRVVLHHCQYVGRSTVIGAVDLVIMLANIVGGDRAARFIGGTRRSNRSWTSVARELTRRTASTGLSPMLITRRDMLSAMSPMRSKSEATRMGRQDLAKIKLK